MSLVSMVEECSKYVEPKKQLHVFEYYAEQFSRIPKKYHLMPASEVMEWVERNTVRHFKHKYFKKFESQEYEAKHGLTAVVVVENGNETKIIKQYK
jgi:hypothetical protein